VCVVCFVSDTVNDIVVTWSTANRTKESIVEYGIGGLILTANGTSTLFISGGNESRKQYIHRVKLPNLISGTKYSKSVYLRPFIVNFFSHYEPES
jgi:hypothetical protein